MSWFYATKEQKQAGPVDETTLQGLRAADEITPETLIWKQGMDGWKPYGTIFGAPGQPGAAAGGPVRCAECGQAYPPDQVIVLAGRTVCASCKPVAVQKFQEGVVSFGEAVDAEELWNKVKERGFNFTISSVLSRSWALVKGNFWPSVGVTLLGYLVIMASSNIPLLGIVAGILVQPQMLAGMMWYFLRQFRGEKATVNDSFMGFKRGYGQQALYMLTLSVIIFGLALIVVVPAVLAIPMFDKGQSGGAGLLPVIIMVAAGVPALLAIWYFAMSWMFVPLLIFEKGMKAAAAMKLSRRVVGLRFWKLFGLFLVVGLLGLAGLLALLIGLLVVAPLGFAVMARVYEDAFGDKRPAV